MSKHQWERLVLCVTSTSTRSLDVRKRGLFPSILTTVSNGFTGFTDPVNLVVSKPASPNCVSAVLDLLTPLVATWLQLLLKYSPLT